MRTRHPLLTILGALLALALTVMAYRPGLDGDFVFDDYANILQNTNIQIADLTVGALWYASMEGYPGGFRPLSILSLALNAYAGRDDLVAYEFKLINLGIHILTGIGLGFLAYLLLTALPNSRLSKKYRIGISCFTASAWLLHPFNLTNVLYVVQRMNSLAALMMSIGMIMYVLGRLRQQTHNKGWALILTGTLLFGLLAFLSKENGILLPLYLLVIEFSIFRFQADNKQTQRAIKHFFIALFLLPALFFSLYFFERAGFMLSGYAIREFSLTERLMTEARVVIWYLRMLLLPDNAQMGLFLDDFSISRSLVDPPTTLASIAAILALIGLALRTRRSQPILALGIFWFFAGHTLESTILPLELVFEHRNYLPGFGILLTAMYYLLNPASSPSTERIRWLAGVAMILLLAFNLNGRAWEWSNPLQHALLEAEHHPMSPRAHFQVGAYFADLAKKQTTPEKRDEFAKSALAYFDKSQYLRPSMAGALIAQIIVAEEYHQPRDPAWLPRLLEILPDGPFEVTNLNALNGLTVCQILRVCRLSESDYMSIIEAALQNKSLLSNDRASVYAYAADYHGHIKRNYLVALDLAERAAEVASTSIRFRRERLKWLLALNRDEDAIKELDYIETLDTLRTMRPWILKQRKAILDAPR
jgi:hypothetical protein